MHTLHPYSIFHLGDRALTIDFGNVIDRGVHQKVMRLYEHLAALKLPFIIDLVPAYSSLAVYYDVHALKLQAPAATAFDTISDQINAMAIDLETATRKSSLVEIPVCYALPFSMDSEVVRRQHDITHTEIIRMHTERTYHVYMLGFIPGFAYMGEVTERLEIPRKETPRLKVPAGSVGIAGKQTGIYPLESPGGWQIIGRTPMPLFDKDKENPVRLSPGDEVKFYSITEDEFAHYQGRPV